MAFHWVNGELEEDALKKKQRELASCTARYDSAVSLIENTASELVRLGEEMDSKIKEIDAYMHELSQTKEGLVLAKNRNDKVAANFRALLEA